VVDGEVDEDVDHGQVDEDSDAAAGPGPRS